MSDSGLWKRFKDWIIDDHDPHKEIDNELDYYDHFTDPKYELWMMEMSRVCRDIARQLDTIAEDVDDEDTKQHIQMLSCDVRELEEGYVTEYAYISPEWGNDE